MKLLRETNVMKNEAAEAPNQLTLFQVRKYHQENYRIYRQKQIGLSTVSQIHHQQSTNNQVDQNSFIIDNNKYPLPEIKRNFTNREAQNPCGFAMNKKTFINRLNKSVIDNDSHKNNCKDLDRSAIQNDKLNPQSHNKQFSSIQDSINQSKQSFNCKIIQNANKKVDIQPTYQKKHVSLHQYNKENLEFEQQNNLQVLTKNNIKTEAGDSDNYIDFQNAYIQIQENSNGKQKRPAYYHSQKKGDSYSKVTFDKDQLIKLNSEQLQTKLDSPVFKYSKQKQMQQLYPSIKLRGIFLKQYNQPNINNNVNSSFQCNIPTAKCNKKSSFEDILVIDEDTFVIKKSPTDQLDNHLETSQSKIVNKPTTNEQQNNIFQADTQVKSLYTTQISDQVFTYTINDKVSIAIEKLNQFSIPWSLEHVYQSAMRLKGKGSYGQVYEAFDPQTKQKIALKFIKLRQLPSNISLHNQDSTTCQSINNQFNRILREVAINSYAYSINSSCIIRPQQKIYQYNILQQPKQSKETTDHDNEPFIIIPMELAEFTLEEMCQYRTNKNKPYTESQLLYTFKQLIDIAICLETAGIAHRDIKPSNLLFTIQDQRWKLSDFGLSVLMHQQSSDNRIYPNNGAVGTWLYASPELQKGLERRRSPSPQRNQIKEQTEIYNLRANDYYSLGLVMLRLASLEGEFNAKTVKQRLAYLNQRKDLPNLESSTKIMLAFLDQCEEKRANLDLQLLISTYLPDTQLQSPNDENMAEEIHENKLIKDLSGENIDRQISHKLETSFAYQKVFDFKKAEEQFDQLMQVMKSVTIAPSIKAQIYGNYGQLKLQMGQFEESLNLLREALKLYSELDGQSSENCASILNNIGTALQQLQRFDEALQYYEQDLQIMQGQLKLKINNSKEKQLELATTYNNIGVVLNKLKRHQDAEQNLTNALKIRQKFLGLTHPDVATTINNLGYVMANCGNYRKALDYYHECLKIRKVCFQSNNPGVANVLMNIASVLESLGQIEESANTYKEALQIYLTFENTYEIQINQAIQAFVNLTSIQIKNKQFQIAKINLQFIKKINNQQVFQFFCQIQVLMAKSLSGLGDFEQAIDELNEALKVMNGKEMVPNFQAVEGEVYFELSKNYEKKKLINRAFEYINLAISSLGISSTNQGGEMEKFKRYLYSLYN